MWSEQSSSMFLGVIAASIIAHVVLLAVLPPAEIATEPKKSTLVMIETPPPPPKPVPPPPIEQPPTETVAARAAMPRAARPVRKPATPRPEIETTEPPPQAAEPVDFSGVTLSNEGASWSSPVGNGEPMTGPITAPREEAPRRAQRGPAGPSSSERVVAVGDLSRPPKAPDLDAALVANYPSEARRAGTTGKAVVRARILADGSVGPIRVVSESAAGFGTACKRTLAGSHWQAPLDKESQAVITDISYTCTFAVAR